jgi:hypothetical protein
VNERIRDVNSGFARLGGTPDWVEVFCECGCTRCLERVRVPSGVYEEVRQSNGCFLVAPDHEDSQRVVAEEPSYRVVMLDGGPRTRTGGPLRAVPAAGVRKAS